MECINKIFRWVMLGFFLNCLYPFQTQAQINKWNGAGDGISWHDNENWDIKEVPKSNDQVIIDNGDEVVIQALQMAEAYWLFVENSKLTILGDLVLNNNDTFGIKGVKSEIHNVGTLIIEESGNTVSNDYAMELITESNFINDGKIEIIDFFGTGIRLENSSKFQNNDSLIFNNGNGPIISIQSSSEMTNLDTIFSNSRLGIDINTGTFFNKGYMDIIITYDDGIGLSLINGSLFENSGETLYTFTAGFFNLAVALREDSELRIHSGRMVCDMPGICVGIDCFSNSSLIIESGASLVLNGTPECRFLYVTDGSTFACDGVFEINE